MPKAKAGTFGLRPVNASSGVTVPVFAVGRELMWSTVAIIASDSNRDGKTYDKPAFIADNLYLSVCIDRSDFFSCRPAGVVEWEIFRIRR